MSQFLGREDCIESLRRDLVDLQGATLDVFSRTGPVRFTSWKFPDKLSCNLDMFALLEQYDFVDGEEELNQHSHIVLLELVIDRLLLLLQSFNAYVEQIRSSYRREQPQQKGCLSVGLVVRNYWSNLVQFSKLKAVSKNQAKEKISDDETESVSTFCFSACSSTSSFQSLPQNHTPSTSAHSIPCLLKADSHNVSCQTFESSLVPCDACQQVQSILRKTGDALVELLQSENLPSSLQPLLEAVEDTLELGHMTASDVTQWATEQLRDMRRLAKHLQDVRATVQPLRDRAAVAEADRDRFKSEMDRARKEFRKELEKHQANTVQLEFSLRKAQRSMKETEDRLQEELQQLRKESLLLEESKSRLTEKVVTQEHTLQTLECQKNALQEKLRTLNIEEDVCCKLQQKIQQLESHISDTELRLDKESAKYNSACRQQESMQAKHKSLLNRIDALDEECEELQRLLGESDEKKINLHKQLQQMAEEKQQEQTQLKQQQVLCSELQKEKQTLETQVDDLKKSVAELKEEVRALKETERLLVAFPELSPLTQAQPQSTGDVLLDMEQQLQANSIRIKVLEQENSSLLSSFVKLRERTQRDASREATPEQTWCLPVASTTTEKQQDQQTQEHKSPLQSSSATRLGYSDRKETRWGESGLESCGSEDRVSSTTASPSTMQLHLQSLHLDLRSTAAKSHMKTHSAPHRSINQRKKWN